MVLNRFGRVLILWVCCLSSSVHAQITNEFAPEFIYLPVPIGTPYPLDAITMNAIQKNKVLSVNIKGADIRERWTFDTSSTRLMEVSRYQRHVHADKSLLMRNVYRYDSTGRIIAYWRNDIEHKVLSSEVYRYDTAGILMMYVHVRSLRKRRSKKNQREVIDSAYFTKTNTSVDRLHQNNSGSYLLQSEHMEYWVNQKNQLVHTDYGTGHAYYYDTLTGSPHLIEGFHSELGQDTSEYTIWQGRRLIRYTYEKDYHTHIRSDVPFATIESMFDRENRLLWRLEINGKDKVFQSWKYDENGLPSESVLIDQKGYRNRKFTYQYTFRD